MKKKEILENYLTAAMSSIELDVYDIADFSVDSVKQAKKEVDTFLKKANGLLDGIKETRIGLDLWHCRDGFPKSTFFTGLNLGKHQDKLQKIAANMGKKEVVIENYKLVIK